MILYLDTSALVKLYVDERGSADVRAGVRAAERVATSRVAYPEARAALARGRNEGQLGQRDLRRAVDALDRDMDGFAVVEIDRSVARAAGELAGKHQLRGFDSIHIVSALELGRLLATEVGFMTFDARQSAAAAAEGLLLPEVL